MVADPTSARETLAAPQDRLANGHPQTIPAWMAGPSAVTEPYEAINLTNFEEVPQIAALPESLRWPIRVVGSVLPFKANRYVIDHLIDWDNVERDGMFHLTFPQRDMLAPEQFDRMAALLQTDPSAAELKALADEIRMELNPHPAGQMEHNVPSIEGEVLPGMQHKYRETVLFFPSQGQTCHAYCTFCFRWPQFVGLKGQKFAMREADRLRDYVEAHPEVSDVLFTGGDPMIMRTDIFRAYVEPLLEPGRAPHVRTVRIGSKALGYWPHRFVADDDADELLALFRRVIASGRQLAFMAHFNHPAELESQVTREAIARLRGIGVQIRTQTPLLRHINDDPDLLARMWSRQAQLGLIPYYLFVARDTGARRYFELPLAEAWEIFRQAYGRISGLARTVRGPSMSSTPGKVQVLGVSDIAGERVFTLRFLQARNPDWVGRPFFARYNPDASWLDDLEPAFGEDRFFYQDELDQLLAEEGSPWSQQRALPLLDVYRGATAR